jgi:hypothetical protein
MQSIARDRIAEAYLGDGSETAMPATVEIRWSARGGRDRATCLARSTWNRGCVA